MGLLTDLLKDEQFLLGAGLLSAGSQGKAPGEALIPSLLQTGQLKKAFTPTDKRTELQKNMGSIYPEGSPEYNDAMKQKLLPTKDARTPLMKNIEAAGVEKGTPEYNNFILTKLFPPETSTQLIKNIEAMGLKQGTPEFNNAMSAAIAKTEAGFDASSPFGKNASKNKAVSSATFSFAGADKLTYIANLTNQSPEVFGLKGSVLGFGSGVQKEIQGMFVNDISNFNIDEGAMELLANPDFSSMSSLENSLKVNIARTRNPAGKLMKDMLSEAKQDANLTGLGGVIKVREKLPTLFKEFMDNARSQYKLGGMSDPQIDILINAKTKEFENALGGKVKKSSKKNKGGLPQYEIVDGKLVLKKEDE